MWRYRPVFTPKEDIQYNNINFECCQYTPYSGICAHIDLYVGSFNVWINQSPLPQAGSNTKSIFKKSKAG